MSQKDSPQVRRRGNDAMSGNGKDETPNWTDADEAELMVWVRERGLKERQAQFPNGYRADVPVPQPDEEIRAERRRRQEQKSRRAEAMADRRQRPEWYLRIAQVPENFQTKTWEDFTPLPGKEQGLEAVRDHAAGKRKKAGLYLHGAVGGGKSLLAALYFRQRLLDGIELDSDWNRFAEHSVWPPPLLWENVAGLLRRVRARCFGAGNSTEKHEIALLSHVEVLVLDDLGVKVLSEWAEEFLLAVVDNRWTRNQVTLVTTNYRPDGLVHIVGERIASRIMGLCKVAEVGGDDMRRTCS